MHIEGKIHPIFGPLLIGLASISEGMKLAMDEQLMTIYVDRDMIKVITANKNGPNFHIAVRAEIPTPEEPNKVPPMDNSGPGDGENVN